VAQLGPRGFKSHPRRHATEVLPVHFERKVIVLVILRVIFGVAMYEDHILYILEVAQRPLSIAEVREALAEKLEGEASYETTKRDLITLSAKGLIHSKSIGKGKRTTWVFWARKGGQPATKAPFKRVDPFKVSIAERDSMSHKELVALYDYLVEEYGSLIRNRLVKGSRHIILCDGKVVQASSYEPSDKEVKDLENRLGKVCYVLTEDPIEESSWGILGDGDYYPSIEVLIGGAEWKEMEVFNHGLRIAADFDTGNRDIAAFSHEDLNLIRPVETRIMRRAFHLGRPYDYYLVTLKIGVKDSVGATRCLQKTSRSVLSWTEFERNPFLLANPTRKGFVGRDLMLAFPFNVLLSGRNKRSKVLLE